MVNEYMNMFEVAAMVGNDIRGPFGRSTVDG